MHNQFLDLPFTGSQFPAFPREEIPNAQPDEEDPPLLKGMPFSIHLPYSSVSPSTLLELGLDPVEFFQRLTAAINPMSIVRPEQWLDGDMAGYVLFIVILGFLLLLV